MKEHLLLDIDVLLDLFFDRKPFAVHISKVLTLCEKKEIKGFTTPLIIANIYYLLRKTTKHDIVIEKLNQLLKIIDIVQMDRTIVLQALHSNFKDFEDALQNFSTMENENIKIILTRNIKDFKNSKLAVLTPETYIKGKQ